MDLVTGGDKERCLQPVTSGLCREPTCRNQNQSDPWPTHSPLHPAHAPTRNGQPHALPCLTGLTTVLGVTPRLAETAQQVGPYGPTPLLNLLGDAERCLQTKASVLHLTWCRRTQLHRPPRPVGIPIRRCQCN